MFKTYQSNLVAVLKVVDMEHILFYMVSESYLDTKYNISLSTHFCNCPTHISTCKHILGVE